jgi:hypothetical protein
MSTGAIFNLKAKEIMVVNVMMATVVVRDVTIISVIGLAILAIQAMGFWVVALVTREIGQPMIVPVATWRIVESENVPPV